MQSRSKQITVCALLAAIGLILGYIESFIVIPVGIPGIKIGLANAAAVIALFMFGPVQALFVQAVRVILSSLLFGSAAGFMYSISGAALAYIVMLIMAALGFSVISASTGGGIIHNIAQVFVAYLVIGNTSVFLYLPVLCLSGVFAGVITGFLSDMIIKRLYKITGSKREDLK